MQIVLLGTTGYHPNDRRQTACMMMPEIGVVFDAGTGMYRVRQHLATPHLDVFLSHAHLDHIIGLTFLFDVLWEKEDTDVRVHALPEKIEQIDAHLFSESLFPARPPFSWHPVDPQSSVTLADGSQLQYFPLRHPGGSLGFRIDWPDRSLAYVTDTVADVEADYVDAIAGVDLLIHECYFPDGWEDRAELTGHSCVSPVAHVARKANVGRLVLVHLNPMIDSDDPIGIETARDIFPETTIGEDHMSIDF